MTDQPPVAPDKTKTEFSLLQLLPNMLTIAAICAGISAIRFAAEGNIALAVALITLASILDGMDGRTARYLGFNSKIGAELDSLADFVNFGVAPPLVVYFWGLQDSYRAGWLAVLVFAICCVMRLARFNVAAKSDEPVVGERLGYFTGIPSPAGALLAMLPMFVSFSFSGGLVVPDLLICFHMVVIGFLMISRIPTWSPKAVKISRENGKDFLVGWALAGAAVLTYAWTTLVVLCLVYVVLVVWGLIRKVPD